MCTTLRFRVLAGANPARRTPPGPERDLAPLERAPPGAAVSRWFAGFAALAVQHTPPVTASGCWLGRRRSRAGERRGRGIRDNQNLAMLKGMIKFLPMGIGYLQAESAPPEKCPASPRGNNIEREGENTHIPMNVNSAWQHSAG